ncbi:Hypp1592 [Branchiostoma lanceolatum]|nr:Hypp1592 [Branchiostoma lanceolatum]
MSTQAAPPARSDLNYSTRDVGPLLQLRTWDDAGSVFPRESRPLVQAAPPARSDLTYSTRDVAPLLQLRTCDDAGSVFPRESRPLVQAAPPARSDLTYSTRDVAPLLQLRTCDDAGSVFPRESRPLVQAAPPARSDLTYSTRDVAPLLQLRTCDDARSVFPRESRPLVQAAPPARSDLTYSTRDVAPLLQLRTCDDARSVFPRESRPLVLLFGWLGAKPRGLDRYRDVYTARGYDVLTVRGRLAHFAWPPRAVTFTEGLLTFLQQETSERRLIVHAFSVGAYLYSIFLLHMQTHPDRYGGVRTRIIGQVHDSVVYGGLDMMAAGVAEVSPLPGALVRSAAMAYFWLTRPYTVDTYNRAIDTFIRGQVAAPTLLFYCENDPMSRAEAMRELVQYWRQAGVALQVRSWRESRHAGHIVVHRDEYLQTLGGFLDSLPVKAKAKL